MPDYSVCSMNSISTIYSMFKFLKEVKNPLGFTRFSVGIPTGVEEFEGKIAMNPLGFTRLSPIFQYESR